MSYFLVEAPVPGPLPGLAVVTPYGMSNLPYGIFKVSEAWTRQNSGIRELSKPLKVLLTSAMRNYPVAVAKASYETTLLCVHSRRIGKVVSPTSFLMLFENLLKFHVDSQWEDLASLVRITEDTGDVEMPQHSCAWFIGISRGKALVVNDELEINVISLDGIQLKQSFFERATEETPDYLDPTLRNPKIPERLLRELSRVVGSDSL